MNPVSLTTSEKPINLT